MELSLDQRRALFWAVCIPLRWTLASLGDRPLRRLYALVIGSRWVFGMEKGVKGAFGGRAWWAAERRTHGILWLAYASTGRSMWLKADTLYGVHNWMQKSD